MEKSFSELKLKEDYQSALCSAQAQKQSIGKSNISFNTFATTHAVFKIQ